MPIELNRVLYHEFGSVLTADLEKESVGMLSPDRSLIEDQLFSIAHLDPNGPLLKRLDGSVQAFLATLTESAEGHIIEDLCTFHRDTVTRLALRAILEDVAFRLVLGGDRTLSSAPKIREILDDHPEVLVAQAKGLDTPALALDALDDHQLRAAWSERASWLLQERPNKDASVIFQLRRALAHLDDPIGALNTTFAGQAAEIAAQYLVRHVLAPLNSDMGLRDEPLGSGRTTAALEGSRLLVQPLLRRGRHLVVASTIKLPRLGLKWSLPAEPEGSWSWTGLSTARLPDGRRLVPFAVESSPRSGIVRPTYASTTYFYVPSGGAFDSIEIVADPIIFQCLHVAFDPLRLTRTALVSLRGGSVAVAIHQQGDRLAA